ncbi:hypothetical protein HYX13_05285 [Candidatus Woesearchaeota archaeon]|nr:hypothetical protein [Candidatus Woesearchaeota archaeon]
MKTNVMTMSLGMLVLFSLVFAGCVDYKTQDLPTEEQQAMDLVNEIAQVEQELAASGETGNTVENDGNEVVAESDGNSITGAAVAEATGLGSEQDAPENTESGEVEEALAEQPLEVIEEVVLPELTEQPEEVEVAEEDNVAEEVEEAAGEEESVITIKENELVKLRATVTDPDNDQVTYSFSKPLDGNGQWKTSYGDAGEYSISLTATDGKLTSEKKVKLVVERVNVAPVISALKNLVVKEGEQVKFTPEVKDPNNDKVTVAVSEPLENGVFNADHFSAGTYVVTITATDGELTTEETFTLTVQDVNQLPQLAGLAETITVKEGKVVTLKPEVTDADEDEVTLTITDPVGNGGVWETKYTDHGEYFITVSANDGKDIVSKRIKVIVEDVNMPPQIVDVVLVNR